MLYICWFVVIICFLMLLVPLIEAFKNRENPWGFIFVEIFWGLILVGLITGYIH